jgi:hypothetical protein
MIGGIRTVITLELTKHSITGTLAVQKRGAVIQSTILRTCGRCVQVVAALEVGEDVQEGACDEEVLQEMGRMVEMNFAQGLRS